MAEIDGAAFARALSGRLDQLGYSIGRAVEKWPLTNKAMLSRAINGKPLSAGNYLLLCEMAGLDPYAFLDREKSERLTRKDVISRAVTALATRETGARHG